MVWDHGVVVCVGCGGAGQGLTPSQRVQAFSTLVNHQGWLALTEVFEDRERRLVEALVQDPVKEGAATAAEIRVIREMLRYPFRELEKAQEAK